MQIRQTIIAHYNNQDIIEYQMIMPNGFQVNFLNYGCIITQILAPDKNNNFNNVVLANLPFDPNNPGHLGALTGRIAGRIAYAKFTLNNKLYHLDKNNGLHNLHGGPNGLDKQMWEVTFIPHGARLHYRSPDNESGFPGNVQFIVEYLILEDNSLTLKYHAMPDTTTIINLTNHSYFDLSCGYNPLAQELHIDADYYAEINSSGIVSGIISPVKDTPFDFREIKSLQSGIISNHPQITLANGYDHPLVLTNKQITLHDPQSLRQLKITTDQQVCVVYSANHLNHRGLCLETQAMPNAINWHPYQPSVIYTPEKPYYSHNIWQFSINPDK